MSSPRKKGEVADSVATAMVMQQVLDQMERAFQTDHKARRERIQQLEQRQHQLEETCQAVEREQHKKDQADSASKHAVNEELANYSAQCDESVQQLLEECRLATEEKRRLATVNEGLDSALRRSRDQNSQLQSKVEQLARNVVRALKDRSSLAEELDGTKAALENEKANVTSLQVAKVQRDEALASLSDLRTEKESSARQLAVAELEIKRLNILLEKHVQDDRRQRKDSTENHDRVLGQLTQQLTDVNAEREMLAASVAESQLTNERLADELKQLLTSRRERDLQISNLEKELVAERTKRLSLERQVAAAVDKRNGVVSATGVLSPDAVAEVGDLYEAQKEITRLQALLDRTTLESQDSTRHAEQRTQHVTALYEQAVERCKGYETSLLELRHQAATALKEKAKSGLVAQALRQRILQLQADAASTAAAIQTTKSDAEEAIANATSDLSLKFAQQVNKDFAATAYFFHSLRQLDVDATIRSVPQPAGGSGDLLPPAPSPAPTTHTPEFAGGGSSSPPAGVMPSSAPIGVYAWSAPSLTPSRPDGRVSPAAADYGVPLRSVGAPSTRSASGPPLVSPSD